MAEAGTGTARSTTMVVTRGVRAVPWWTWALLAALLLALLLWAMLSLRAAVSERDALRGRVAELEAQAAQAAVLPAPQPLPTAPVDAPYVPPIDPGISDVEPAVGGLAPPPQAEVLPESGPLTEPAAPAPQQRALDCLGPDRDRPGCRPVPERPVTSVPDRLTPRGPALGPSQPN